MSAPTNPTILLVHGAAHGSWCWTRQIPELEALGYAVQTADLPSASGTTGITQDDDAAAVRAALLPLLAAGSRVVVLAHSYGGPIGGAAVAGLSEPERAAAGQPGGVLGLVVLCGFVFSGGLDQGAMIRSVGGLPYVNWDSPKEGLFDFKDPRPFFFPPDVTPEDVEWAVARLRPQSMAANMGLVPSPQAWQQDAYGGGLGYIRCTHDAALPVSQQDAMVEDAGGSGRWVVRSLEGSGHSPFLSRPKEVAVALHEIVAEFEKNRR